MNLTRYRKGADAAQDAAFAAAQKYGHICVGGEWIFCRKGLFWYALPASAVVRAYRRVEQVQSHTGCCENDFDIHRLVLQLNDGTQQTLLIGDGLFRHEPEQLIDAMQALWPAMAIGLPQPLKC